MNRARRILHRARLVWQALPPFMTRSHLWPRLVRTWQHRLPPAGRAFAVAGIYVSLSGFLQVAFGRTPWLFSGWFVLFAAAALAGQLFRPRVSIRRAHPLRAKVGASFDVVVTIVSTATRRLHDLEVHAMPPPGLRLLGAVAIPRLDPTATAEACLALAPERRGDFALGPVAVADSRPFGLWNSLRIADPGGHVIVHPAFQPLAALRVPDAASESGDGQALRDGAGESVEFLGTREYRRGDNPRHLHAASWARRGTPVVKTFLDEAPTACGILLDSWRAAGPFADDEPFEAAVSLCAAIADHLHRGGRQPIFPAWDPAVRRLQPAARGLDPVLDALALARIASSPVFAATDARELAALGAGAWILVALRWDDSCRSLSGRLDAARIRHRAIVIRSGKTTADAGTAAMRVLAPDQALSCERL